MVQRLNLTRDQLASFLQDHEQVKQFERLFATVNTLDNFTIDEVNTVAGNALASANDALAQLSAVSQMLDLLVTAPRNELGTISYQNADDVNITGGEIKDLDVPLPVNSGGTGQSSFVNGELLIGNSTGNTLTVINRWRKHHNKCWSWINYYCCVWPWNNGIPKCRCLWYIYNSRHSTSDRYCCKRHYNKHRLGIRQWQ